MVLTSRVIEEKPSAGADASGDVSLLRARLAAVEEELRANAEQLEATSEVLRAIAAAPADLESVLNTICELAVRLSDASVAGIRTFEGGKAAGSAGTSLGSTSPLQARGMANAPEEVQRTAWAGERWVMRERRLLHIPDMAALDETNDYGGIERAWVQARQLGRTRTWLGVPVMRHDQPIGVLVVRHYDTPRGFTPKEIALLETFASQAAIAIEHTRLFTELQRHERELEEKAQQLAEASQHKSRFLANMSHELRTPLTAIIGYSEMVQEQVEDLGPETAGPMAGHVRRITTAGRHLLALINDVLDISKIEAGKMELVSERFDVGELVENVTAVTQPLAERNGNRLEVRCDRAAVGEMVADQAKVRQAVLNLLSNACKFTQNGTVTLEVGRTGGESGEWLTFTVRDTGIGMNPAQVERLFEEFQQAEATTTRKYGGTGLGLALSRRLCRLMGGDITAESELHKGSVFTMRLPA